MDMNRRTFLKTGAATALGLALSSALPVKTEAHAEEAASSLPEDFASMVAESTVVTDAITSFDEEHEYDVVVVGAGTTGVPAAISAYQSGASVAVLQKQAMIIAQGNLCAKVVKEKSTEIGMRQYIHYNHKLYDYRNNTKLWERYVDRSEEAVNWFVDQLNQAGFDDYKESDSKDHVFEDGNCYIEGTLFPSQMIAPMQALGKAYEDKIDFYYETPAVQLVKEGGRIVGVIGKNKAGEYVKFTATKGVILTTGDYQNNVAMKRRYNPDTLNFETKQSMKTGDGHLMAMAAGAQICPGVHSKMVHGASMLREEPLLAVNGDGIRFMEEDIEYTRRNTILKEMKNPFMWSLFDANYFDYVYGWGSDPTVPTVANGTPEKLAAFIEKGSVLTANSIEELAALMEVDPVQLKATVDHYNELCAEGFDYDFGKPSKYMKPVDTAPFYAVKRVYQVSAICDGLKINENGQVLDMENNPMEGLYAAGNCSGCFYGDVDYSLDTMGLSIGRCVTFGYLVGQDVAAL